MEKVIVLPRNRYEDESLEDYKLYLREIYFDSQKPEPLTRYDFAKLKDLPDTYEIMDGENGEYTKYLEEYYEKYYKKLDKKVTKAIRKYESNHPNFNRFTNSIKLPKFNFENSKVKSIIDKFNNFSISENSFRKVVNTMFYITLGVTILSLASFFLMKEAIGLIIGTIGILAAKTLAPERKTKEERQTKNNNKENTKSKLSFRKIKDKLVNVFAKKKTTSESNIIAEEEIQEDIEEFDGFDTTIEEIDEEEVLFDTNSDEIEVIKDAEEIHIEPEVVFDTRGSQVETLVNPEIIKEESEIVFDISSTEEEQEFSFDTSVSEYKLNEGQAGNLEPNSLTVPNTDTKLFVYIPNFFKEKIAKLNSKKNVKVMKK